MKTICTSILIFSLSIVFSQNQQLKLDSLQKDKLKQLSSHFYNKYKIKKEAADLYALQHNLPIKIILADSSVIELQEIRNGLPIYYGADNLNAAKTISTNHVWSGGDAGLNLSGSGMSIGLWDEGKINLTHQEFGGRVIWMAGETNSYSSHSTHVAGTLIAGGVIDSAKGMAYEANIIGRDWTNDLSEMAIEHLYNNINLSNHSYGEKAGWVLNSMTSQWEWYGDPDINLYEDQQFGFYSDKSSDLDIFLNENPFYLPVIAAGNDRVEIGPASGTWKLSKTGEIFNVADYKPYSDGGNDINNKYDCLATDFKTSKNALVVGAVNDIVNGYTSPSDIVMTTFSSWGPTDDGRIKPDIVANGNKLFSTNVGSTSSYTIKSGTSMAAPSVTGSLLLLQQHYSNLNAGQIMKSATLKGLVIHTADHPTEWPSYKYGWGLLNTKSAAEVISADETNGVKLQELVLIEGATYSSILQSDGSEPVKVTIVWNDPAPIFEVDPTLDNPISVLVNDLDLRVKRLSDNTLYYPYKLDKNNPTNPATNFSDNNIDNVEYVYFTPTEPGDYEITITHKGMLAGGSQEYALIISGLNQLPAPEIEWQNTIGGSKTDILNCVEQVSDGGYILGGYSASGISGDKTEANLGTGLLQPYDYWVVKLNSNGIIQWQNTIGGSSEDVLNSLQQTSDGGYILGGYSKSDISGDKSENAWDGGFYGYDYWILKLDLNGDILWQNTIGGNDDDKLYSIQQTTDGGYILGGYSASGIAGDKTESSEGDRDYWVVKTNNLGIIEWQNTIGGSSDDELYAIQQTADGGYILGGHSNSGISGDKVETNFGSWDYWVVKLNSSGMLEWQNTIGGSSTDQLYSIQQTADGGYILGGSSSSDISDDKSENNWEGQGSDYWVVKIDDSGNIEWEETLGGYHLGPEVYFYGDDLFCIKQTYDGNYILAGSSNSDACGDKTEMNMGGPGPLNDYWILKLDASGNIIWQNTIGGGLSDDLKSISQTTDNGFILGGYSASSISGDKTESTLGSNDYWVIKLYGNCIPPLALITPGGPTTFCTGSSVLLQSSTGLGYTYQWYKNGVIISGAATSNYIATTSGNYKVLVTSGTCTAFSSETIVTVNPKPNAAITNVDATNDLCFDSNIKLKTTNGVGYTYQWYKNGVAIGGGINSIYFAISTGQYKVKVINGFGCNKISSPYNIIQTCRLIDTLGNDLYVSLYPNPNNGSFTLLGSAISNDKLVIKIFNILGDQIYENAITCYSNEVNAEIKLPDTFNGIALVRIEFGSTAVDKILIIEK